MSESEILVKLQQDVETMGKKLQDSVDAHMETAKELGRVRGQNERLWDVLNLIVQMYRD